MKTKTMKTWGTAMRSLSDAIKKARNCREVLDNYGTNKFFHIETLSIHRTFQAWCEDCGICPIYLRNEMRVQYNLMNPTVTMVSGAKLLLTTIPDEFNVRGIWTPEIKEVI